MSKLSKFTSLFTTGIAGVATVLALIPQTPATTELEKFTVDYMTGYAEDIANDEAYSGSTLRLPIIEREGYNFLGWSLTEGGAVIDDTVVVTADMVLYAKYSTLLVTTEEFTVTFINEITGEYTTETYTDGDNLELTTPTLQGYEFVGWFNGLSNSALMFTEDSLVLENLVLFAQFDEIVIPDDLYTITFYTNGGNDIDPIDVEPGQPFTLPEDPIRAGLVFIEWVYNCSFDGLGMTCTTFDESVVLTSDINVYAKYDYLIPTSSFATQQFFTYDADEEEIIGGGYFITQFDSNNIPDAAYDEDGFINELTLPTTINGHRILGIVGSLFAAMNFRNVVIPEGYMFIGDSTFAYSEIESLSLPASLTTITYEAFAGSAIGELNFADESRLTTISSGAFKNSLLPNFVLPSSVMNIEYQAFSNASFESFTIPSDSQLLAIGYEAFSSANISAIDLPDTLLEIDSNAFSNTLIESITIPSSLRQIGSNTFENTPLQTVNFEGGNQWTSWSGLDTAFLNTPYYTDKTANLDNGMLILSNVLVKYTPSTTSGTNTVVVPEGVEIIASAAFTIQSGSSYDLDITFPTTLKVIGDSAFAGGNNGVSAITFTTTPNFEDTQLISIGNSSFYGAIFPSATTEVITFPNTIRNLSFAAFRGVTANDFVFPAVTHEVTLETAILESSNIRNVTFGEGYTQLRGQFLYNATVNNVSLPLSLKKIGHVDFQALSINDVTYPAGFELLEAQNTSFNYNSPIFANQTADFYYFANMALRNRISTDGTQNYEFDSVPGITAIATNFTHFDWSTYGLNIASLDLTGIKYIGSYAIYLTGSTQHTVHFPSTIEVLGDEPVVSNTGTIVKYEFAPDHKLFDNFAEKMDYVNYFPALWFIENHYSNYRNNYTADADGNVIVGGILLANNSNNEEAVVVPEGVKAIGRDVFRYREITTLTLPESLLMIDQNAFFGAVIGDKVTIPENVAYIGSSAFEDTTLTSGVDFVNPESLRYIESTAFYGSSIARYNADGLLIIDGVLLHSASYLSQITIPESVIVIAKEAFTFQELNEGTDGDVSFSFYYAQTVIINSNVKVIIDQAFDFDEIGVIVFAEDVHLSYLGEESLGYDFTGTVPYADVISPRFAPYSYFLYEYANPANRDDVFIRS